MLDILIIKVETISLYIRVGVWVLRAMYKYCIASILLVLIVYTSIVYPYPVEPASTRSLYSVYGNVFTIVYVPRDYKSIGEALENVKSDAIVVVEPGVYRESINVSRLSRIIVYGYGATIAGVDNSKPVISIQESFEVVFKGFKIVNGSTGIDVVGSMNIAVRDCVFNGVDTGLSVSISSYVVIENNSFVNTSKALDLVFVNKVAIVNNTVENSDYGLEAYRLKNASIVYNRFYDVRKYILCIRVCTNTRAYLNILNGSKIKVLGDIVFNSLGKILYWYNGRLYYGQVGNYWVGLRCIDSNRDGVCEQRFTEGVFIKDKYPLKNPISYYSFIGRPGDAVEFIRPAIIDYARYVDVHGYYREFYMSGSSVFRLYVKAPLDWINVSLYNDSGLVDTLLSLSSVSTGSIDFSIDATRYSDGAYRLYVRYSIAGLNITGYTYMDLVIDNTPVDIVLPKNTLLYNNSVATTGIITIEWKVVDDNYYSSTVYIDGEPVYTTYKYRDRIVVDLDRLGSGTHNITIEAIDYAGHKCSKTLFIEIVSLNNTLHTSLYKETITSIIPSNTLLVYRVFIVVAIAILAITLILLVIYRHRFR